MPEDDGKDFGPWQAIDPSRRYFRRWTVDLPAVVHDRGTSRHCVVHDLCPGGAQLIVGEGEPLAVGAEVVLSLEPYGSISTEVRYAQGDRVGLMFIHGPADEIRLARFLVSLEPPRRPPRVDVQLGALLTAANVQATCVVADISRSGARITLSDTSHLRVGDEVVLNIDGHGELAATVRRIADGEAGLEFHQEFEGALE